MKKPDRSDEISLNNNKGYPVQHLSSLRLAILQNDFDQVAIILERCGISIDKLLAAAINFGDVNTARYLFVECEADIDLSKKNFVGLDKLIVQLTEHAKAIILKLKNFLKDFDIDISFTPIKDSLTYRVHLFSADFTNLQLLGYYLGDECHINNLTVEYEPESYSLLLTAKNMHILNRETTLSPVISAKLQRFKPNMMKFLAKLLTEDGHTHASVTTRQISLKFQLATHRKMLQYCNFLVFRFSDCLDLVGTSAKTEYIFTIRSKDKGLPLYDDPEVEKFLLFDQMEWQNEYPALPPKVASVQPKTVSSEMSDLLNCKTSLIQCLQNITRRENWIGIVAQENNLKLIWRSNDISDLIRVAAYLHNFGSSILIDCKNKRVECNVGNLVQAEGLLCLLKLQAPMSDDFIVPPALYPLYLQNAIEQNDKEQVEFFIEQCGMSLETPLPNTMTPLETAFGFVNSYQYLRNKGARVELTTERVLTILNWIYESLSVPFHVRKIHFLDLLSDIKTQIPMDQWSPIFFALQGDLASLRELYKVDPDALKTSVPQTLFIHEIIANTDENSRIDEFHKFYLDHQFDPVLDKYIMMLIIQFKREKLLRHCLEKNLFSIKTLIDSIHFRKSIERNETEIIWQAESRRKLSSGKPLSFRMSCDNQVFFHFLVETVKLNTVPGPKNPGDISNVIIPCLAAYSGDLEVVKALHEDGHNMNHFALENGVVQHCPMYIAVQRNHVEVAKYLFMNCEAKIPFTPEIFDKRDKIAAILREYTSETIRKLTLFLDKFKIGVGLESDFPTFRVQILKYESSLFEFIVRYLVEECKIENLKKHPDRDEYIFPLDAQNIHILNRPDTLSKDIDFRFQLMQNAVTQLKANFYHPKIFQEHFTTEITTREIKFKFKSQSSPVKLKEFFNFIAFRFSLNVLFDIPPETNEYIISICSKNDKIAIYEDPGLMKLSVSATLSLAARRISKCQPSELPLDWSIVYPIIQKSITKSLFENVNLYSNEDIDLILRAGDLDMNGDLFIYAITRFDTKHRSVMRELFRVFNDGKLKLTDGLKNEDVRAFFGDPSCILNMDDKFTRFYFCFLGKYYACHFHPNALPSYEAYNNKLMEVLSSVSKDVNSDLDILHAHCPKLGGTTLSPIASVREKFKQQEKNPNENKKKIAKPVVDNYADEINKLHCFTKHLDGNVIYRFDTVFSDIDHGTPIIFAVITSAITRGLLRDYFISVMIAASLHNDRLYLEPKHVRSCQASVLSEACAKQLHDYSQLLSNFSWLFKPLLKVTTWEVQEKNYILLLKASANNLVQLDNIPILLQYFWRRCGFEADPKLINVVKSKDQVQLCITYDSLKNPALAALYKSKDDPNSTLLWQLRRITNDLSSHAKPLLNMEDLISVITTAEEARQARAAKSAVKDEPVKPKAVYAKPPKIKSGATNKNRFIQSKPPKSPAVQSAKPKETHAVTHYPPQSAQRRLDPSILPVAPSVSKLQTAAMHDFPAPIKVNSNNPLSERVPSVLPLRKLDQDTPALLPLEEQLIRMQRLISSRHTDCELSIPKQAAFLSAWHFLHGQICNLLRSLDYTHYAKSLIFTDEVYHGEKQYNRQKHRYFPPCLLNASSDILKICFQDLASMRATLSCIVGGTDPDKEAQRLTKNIIIDWSKYVECEYTREDCDLSKILSTFKTPVDFGEWLLKKIRSYTKHIEFLIKEYNASEEKEVWYYAMCFWVGRVGELAGHIPYERRDKYLIFCRAFRNPTSHTFEPKDVSNDIFIDEPTLDVTKLEKCLPNFEKATTFWSKTIPLSQWQFFVSMRYVYSADDICSLTRLRLEQSTLRVEVCYPVTVTANTNLYAMVHATFKLMQDNKTLDKGMLLIPAALENDLGNKNPFAMAMIFQRDNEGVMRLVELSYSFVTQNHYQIPDCIIALQEKWLETAGQKMTPPKPKLLAMKEIELNDVANHGVLQVELLTRLAQHHINSSAINGFSKGKMWLAGLREEHMNTWWQNGMQERYLNQMLKNSSIGASMRAMDLSSKMSPD